MVESAAVVLLGGWYMAAFFVFVLFVVFVVVCGTSYIYSRILKCPPDRVLVVVQVGGANPDSKLRIVREGTTFVLPILEQHFFLDRSPFTLPVVSDGPAVLPPSVTLALDADNDNSIRAAARAVATRQPSALYAICDALTRQTAFEVQRATGDAAAQFLSALSLKVEPLGYTVLSPKMARQVDALADEPAI